MNNGKAIEFSQAVKEEFRNKPVMPQFPQFVQIDGIPDYLVKDNVYDADDHDGINVRVFDVIWVGRNKFWHDTGREPDAVIAHIKYRNKLFRETENSSAFTAEYKKPGNKLVERIFGLKIIWTNKISGIAFAKSIY